MFGLQRITLHNSYYTQKTVSVRTNDHTNNSGTNAAGKTSLLQFIPLFYGCPPRFLNPISKDKLPFLDFALPVSSSLLIFDYNRCDSDCCSVVYRAPNGGIAYRFVKGNSGDTFFASSIAEKLQSGEPASEIFSSLAVIGVEVSKQFTAISEYAAVLQNDTRSLKRRSPSNRSILHEAQRFSLGSADTKMHLMGEMTYTLLTRSKMFERLKMMVTDTQFDYRAPKIPQHRNNTRLSNDLRGLREFSTHKTLLQNCVKSHYERLAVDSQVLRFSRGVKQGTENLSATLVILENKLNDNETQKSLASQSYDTSCSSLKNELNQAKWSHDKINEVTKKAEEEYDKWIEHDITSKQEDYHQIDTFRSKAREAESFLELLEENHSDLVRDRDAKINNIRAEFNQRTKTHNSRIQQLNNGVRDIENAFAAKVKELDQQEIADKQRTREEHEGKQQPLRDNIAKIEQRIESEGYSEKEQLEFEAASEEITTIDNKVDALNSELEQAQEEKETKQQRHNEVLNKVQSQKRAVEQLKSNLSELETLCYPGNGTLLTFLRESHPNWTETIGRVIHPSLLSRTDLSAKFTDKNNTLYGVDLRTDKIKPTDHCQENDTLLERLEQIKITLRIEIERLEDHEAQAHSLYDELNHTLEQISDIQRNIKLLKQRRSEALHYQKALKEQIKVAVADRKTKLKETLIHLKDELKNLEQAYSKQIEAIKENTQIHRKGLLDDKLCQVSDIQLKIEHCEKLHEEDQDSTEESITQINQAYRKQCQENDIDEAAIKKAQQAKTNTIKRLREVEKYADIIREHKSWLDLTWSKQEERKAELHQLSQNITILKTDLSELKRNHDDTIRAIMSDITQIKKNIDVNSRLYNEATAILNNVGAVTEGEAESGELSYLIHQLNSFLDTQRKLHDSVLDSVNRAVRALQSNPDSKVYESWESMVKIRMNNSSHGEHTKEFLLQLPEDLHTLLEKYVPQIHDSLIETVKAVGESFVEFYRTLMQLEVEVGKVSRTLKEKINTDQSIATLEDIQLHLTSKVYTAMDGWEELQNFVQAWNEWDTVFARELPPESLEHSLSNIIEMFQYANIKTDIGSLVDLKITMVESGRPCVIDSNASFDDSSSNGLSYLALIVIFIGMSRYLCPDLKTTLTWPLDELATLDPHNVSCLFEMLNRNNIRLFAAFPSMDYNLLQHFGNRYVLDRNIGARELLDGEMPDEGEIDEIANMLEADAEVI